MDVFLFFVFVFLTAAKPDAGRCSATNETRPANTSTPLVSGDDPTTSAEHPNTTDFGPVAPTNELTAELLLMYRASLELKRIYLTIVIVAGTFGNVVVVVIQRRLPSTQKSSMSVYFTALAVSDTAVLWMGLFDMLETYGDTLVVEHHVSRGFTDVVVDALCRIKVWISYAFGEISAWILVSMTIHRALSIVWPYRTRKLMTTRNTVKVVVFIFLFCALANAHLFYGHSLVPAGKGQKAVCFHSFVSERYSEFFNPVWVLVDMVIAVYLPFVCLFATNTVLVRKVGQSLREAKESLTEGSAGSNQLASRDKKLSSMTLTLIIMSVAFLLLTSPVNFMYMVRMWSYDTGNDIRLRAATELAFSAGLVLWYTNVAINFYLYCLTGARYRAEFLRLFGCGGSTHTPTSHTLAVSRPTSSVNTTVTPMTVR